jgi:hypothetical protein
MLQNLAERDTAQHSHNQIRVIYHPLSARGGSLETQRARRNGRKEERRICF